MQVARLKRCAVSGVLFVLFTGANTRAVIPESLADVQIKPCGNPAFQLVYDARIAWIKAGNLDASICLGGVNYALTGTLQTRGPIEKFIKWRGEYSAVGQIVDDLPKTDTYLVIENNPRKKKRKVVFTDSRTTLIHQEGRTLVEHAAPPGADLISALLLSQFCRNSMAVHDGEEAYEIELADRIEGVRLRQRSPYYTGATDLCRYRLGYKSGKTRRIDVWLADQGSRRFPVRIRVRVPLFPDGVLNLRACRGSECH